MNDPKRHPDLGDPEANHLNQQQIQQQLHQQQLNQQQIPPGTMPPENEPQPKTFTDKTFEAYTALWEQLAREVPELDGVIIQFVWSPQLHQAKLPHAQHFAKNNASNDPSFLLRAMEQLSRSMQNLNQRFQGTLVAGEAAAVDLNNRILEARGQLEQPSNQPSAQPAQPTGGQPVSLFRHPNAPGPTGPSQDS